MAKKPSRMATPRRWRLLLLIVVLLALASVAAGIEPDETPTDDAAENPVDDTEDLELSEPEVQTTAPSTSTPTLTTSTPTLTTSTPTPTIPTPTPTTPTPTPTTPTPTTSTPPVTELPTPPPPTTPTPTSASPLANTVATNAKTNLRANANSASPALLVGLAALCAAFLVLWSRRRRDGAASEPSDKAAYARVGAEEQELLDDEFGGRSGSWDDWDSNSQRVDVADENRDHDDANANANAVSSSARVSTAGVQTASPPSSSRDRLQEIVLAEATPPRATSVASNSSSNESFEVVVSPPAAPVDLLSGSLAADVAAPSSSSGDDDLFSQFGLVPTFKKGVQQTPARSSYAAPAGALNPFAVSPPPSASSMFAADLDDAAGAAEEGANEWGDEDDDDWVQGL